MDESEGREGLLYGCGLDAFVDECRGIFEGRFVRRLKSLLSIKESFKERGCGAEGGDMDWGDLELGRAGVGILGVEI